MTILGLPAGKLAEAFRRLDLLSWAECHRPELRRGIPWQPAEPWLKEIYTDQAREKVLIKAAQVRISEYLLTEALWRTAAHGWNAFYCFPAQNKISDFVKTRVDPAVEASPSLKAARGTDDVRVKRFGNGFITFSGAQTIDQVTTAAADLVIRDEFDFIPPEVRPAILSRYGDSPHKHLRDASHPTYPGQGIDARYQESDQRRWEIPCPACAHWQSLTWDKIRYEERIVDLIQASQPIPESAVHLACERCGRALQRNMPGRWTAQAPGATAHGWHISKLMDARTPLAELLRASLQTSEWARQAFFNMALGQAYSPKGASLDRKILDNCVDPLYALPQNAPGSFAGIDVGAKLHVWIERAEPGQRSRLLAARTLDAFEELPKLMRAYGVRFAVCDALPETREARRWATQHPGRAALAFFGPEKKAELFQYEAPRQLVSIARTMACDDVEREFSETRIRLPANAAELPEVFQHLQAPIRVADKTPDGNTKVAWVSSRPDHFFMAKLYAMIARGIYRQAGYGRAAVSAQNSGVTGPPRFGGEETDA